jgi:hypothetical protein
MAFSSVLLAEWRIVCGFPNESIGLAQKFAQIILGAACARPSPNDLGT